MSYDTENIQAERSDRGWQCLPVWGKEIDIVIGDAECGIEIKSADVEEQDTLMCDGLIAMYIFQNIGILGAKP